MSFHDIRLRRIGISGAIAIAALAIAGTAAAQSIVVRATGPSAAQYPPGTKLQANDRIKLVAGDKVVLVQGGKTRTLSGAGTFTAGSTVQTSQSMGSTVSRMLASRPVVQVRGGMSRSGVEDATPFNVHAPNLWLLDYREGGTFCVADPATLLLWRPDMEGDTALQIESGGQSQMVALVAGANFRKWPIDTLPVQYGVDYRLSGAGLPAPVTVRFTPLEAIPDSVESSIEMLVAKGCTPQLNRLVDTMSKDEQAPG